MGPAAPVAGKAAGSLSPMHSHRHRRTRSFRNDGTDEISLPFEALWEIGMLSVENMTGARSLWTRHGGTCTLEAWEIAKDAFSEIELDLSRTEEEVPNPPLKQATHPPTTSLPPPLLPPPPPPPQMTEEERGTLRCMLRCFALANAKVGYCQAMNFIGLFLIRVCESALHAYGVLLALARQVVPLYFTRSMLGSRIDLAVLKALFAEYLPQLQAHMEVIGVPLELIASKWLVGLFTQVTITGPDSGPDPDSEPQP